MSIGWRKEILEILRLGGYIILMDEDSRRGLVEIQEFIVKEKFGKSKFDY